MMKKFIQAILRKAGWEVHRTSNIVRSSMPGGLRWLSGHGFAIGTVLDVGASDGCWTRECMRYYPGARYVLFEPQPVHGQALDAFVSANDNVSVIRKAVGASQGHTFFDASQPFGGALVSEGEGGKTIRVEMTTVDAGVAEAGADGPFLLKLDTHGFERSILDGAAQTLAQADVLIIEAYNYRITDEAMLFWELCAYLAGKGFRPVDLVDVATRRYDESLWQMDIIFVREEWEGFDYVSYQ